MEEFEQFNKKSILSDPVFRVPRLTQTIIRTPESPLRPQPHLQIRTNDPPHILSAKILLAHKTNRPPILEWKTSEEERADNKAILAGSLKRRERDDEILEMKRVISYHKDQLLLVDFSRWWIEPEEVISGLGWNNYLEFRSEVIKEIRTTAIMWDKWFEEKRWAIFDVEWPLWRKNGLLEVDCFNYIWEQQLEMITKWVKREVEVETILIKWDHKKIAAKMKYSFGKEGWQKYERWVEDRTLPFDGMLPAGLEEYSLWGHADFEARRKWKIIDNGEDPYYIKYDPPPIKTIPVTPFYEHAYDDDVIVISSDSSDGYFLD